MNLDNNNFTNNFKRRHDFIVQENKKNKGKINMFQEDKNIKLFKTDPTNKMTMAEKSFAMLQERYRKGLITIDEFNKKCKELNKFIEKNK